MRFDFTKVKLVTKSFLDFFTVNQHVYFKLFRCIIIFALTQCMSIHHASCQKNPKIDSLNSLLNKAEGADRFEILYNLLRENLATDLEQSFSIAEEAERVAIGLNDSLLIVRAHLGKGVVLARQGIIDQSIEILSRALSTAERKKYETELTKILNFLAIDYSYNGNYDKALECHFKSLQINEARGNKEEIAITYNNIGFVHFKLKDYPTALDYYLKSLNTKKVIGSSFDLDRLLINIALCYNQIGNYTEAERYINEGLATCKNECDSEIKMEAELGMGVSLLQRNKPEEAISHFDSSLLIARKIGQKRFQIENLLSIANINLSKGDNESSLALLKEAELIGNKTQYSYSLIEVYKGFWKVYNQMNDFKNASTYQSKYIQLKDSIYSEELMSNLAKVQTNYAERVNLKTISEQNDIIALKDQVLGKQRTITVLAMVIALLLLGFTYFAIQSGRTYSAKLKRHNEELEQKVLERTKELQKSNEKLLKAQHDLNNFLYKTSHDIRGPVATLKGLYNLITTKQNEPEELKDLIVREGVQIEKIYKILNRISMVTSIQNTFLKPEVIDFHALLNDIVDFERKNGQLKHIRVLVDVEPGLKMISDPYLIHLILENMVDNSLKFFNESTRIDPYVKITVSTSGSDALIKVEDNGVGIIMKPGQDVFTMFLRGSERSDIGGVGLYLCKVIADKLEGTIKLEKTSKEGTTFSLKLTLDATEQIKAWNTYLESEYRQEMERQVEYEKRELDAEQRGKASNPFIAT